MSIDILGIFSPSYEFPLGDDIVGITGDTTWDVAIATTTVDAGPTSTTWEVRVTVNRSRSTTWEVRATVSRSRSTTWDVFFGVDVVGSAAITGDTTWNTHIKVGKSSSSTTWETVGHGAKNTSTTWNVASILPGFDFVSTWFKADKGVTVDGLGGVTTWTNYGSPFYPHWDNSQNHDAVQSSTFARPSLVSGALNGLPVLRFEGTRDFLSINNSSELVYFGNFYGNDVFVVMKDNRGTDGFPRYIISNSDSTAIDVSWFLGTTNNSPTGFLFTAFYGGTKDLTRTNLGRGNAEVGSYVLTTAELTPHGSSFPTIAVNQVDQGATTTSLGSFDFTNQYYIGRFGSFNEGYWQGDIAELIVYGANTLLESEKAQVEDYLKLKWFNLLTVPKTREVIYNVDHLPSVAKTANTTWNSFHNPFLNVPTIWQVFVTAPTEVDSPPRSTTWNTHAHVDSNSMSTTWNVAERPHVGPTLTPTTWNVLHRPITDKTIDTSWNYHHKVSAPITSTSWDLRKLRNKFRTVYFDDLHIVPKIGIESWNVDGSVAKTNSTTWNVRHVAFRLMNPQPLNRTRWDVSRTSDAVVNQQIYSEWNVQQVVPVNDQAIWVTFADVGRTGIVSWTTRAAVSKSPITTWNDLHHAGIYFQQNRWNVFPNALYGFPLWDVRTNVNFTAFTKFKVISYNNNTSNTTWNCCVTVNVDNDTLWNIHSPPVPITNPTTWLIRNRIKKKIHTTWAVGRLRPVRKTTYWEVISGIIYCSSPPPLESVRIRMHVRWNVDGANLPRRLTHASWKVLKSIGHGTFSDGPLAKTANWRVKHLVSININEIWIIGAFTTNVSRDSDWTTFAHANKQRIADWNVRLQMSGSSLARQRDSSWNISKIASKSSSTTWIVSLRVLRLPIWQVKFIVSKNESTTWTTRSAVSKSSGTTWEVGELANVIQNTIWDEKKLAGVSIGTTFTTKLKVGLSPSVIWSDNNDVAKSAQTPWTVNQLVNKSKESLWDYSVVIVGSGSTWSVQQLTMTVDPEGGTLWNVHPPCAATFINADPCHVNNQTGCGSTALLPRITVCELAKDKLTKNYRSKYVKKYL